MVDGLISDDINAMCQDSSGYIWMATAEGLSVFNSNSFTNYSVEDGLPTNNLSCILADRHDRTRIWIGTLGAGVVEYVDGRFIRFGAGLKQKYRSINCLYMDPEGVLWCGTDSGLFRIRDGKIVMLPRRANVAGVNSISEDVQGDILIGADSGFYELRAGGDRCIRQNVPVRKGDVIADAMPLGHTSALVLTRRGVLTRIRGGKQKSVVLSPYGRFTGLFASTSKENVWVASDHGLFTVNTEDLTVKSQWTRKNGLPGDNIQSVFVDQEGVIWLGTNGKGVAKLVYPNLLRFDIPESHKDVYNVSTVVDSHGHVWIATSDRLIELWRDKGSRWHLFGHLDFEADPKHSIGKLCLSGRSDLVLTFSGGTVEEFRIANPNPSSSRPSILVRKWSTNLGNKYKFYDLYVCMADSSRRIWVSAIDLGVVVLSNTTPPRVLKVYTTADGLPDNSIRRIFEDSRGNYWFGGYNEGLACFSRDKVQKGLGLESDSTGKKAALYTTGVGLPDNSVRAITENGRGDILVGTRYGGLAIFNHEIFRKISRVDGLFSNGIWDIACTPSHGTWVATQSGIQRLNGDSTISYELRNVMPRIPFYSISMGAGHFIFANPTEVFVYNPDESHLRRVPPPVLISSIAVNGRRVATRSRIELPDNQNNVTIDFVSVRSVDAGERFYEYRLLNEGHGWTRLHNRNSVTFVSLRPGTYTFQVIALTDDGLKSDVPAEVTFKIDSPFFREWWFEALVLLAVVSIIVGMVKSRERRLLELERVRTRIAEELHDEIGSGLTKIAILSEHAMHASGSPANKTTENTEVSPSSKSIERVGTIARNLVDQMADVIWSIDPKYDRLEDFIIHFKKYAYEVCEARDIELRVGTGNIDNVKLDSQTKRKLHLISVEALNNALKHSRCSRIDYRLGVDGGAIRVEFADNGRGLTMEMIGRGNGLINMRKYVEELKGTIDFGSNEGTGTSIRIKIPLKG